MLLSTLLLLAAVVRSSDGVPMRDDGDFPPHRMSTYRRPAPGSATAAASTAASRVGRSHGAS